MSNNKNGVTVFKDLHDKTLRVAVSCRSDSDVDTLASQRQHFISQYPNWTFVGFYVGEKDVDKNKLLLGGFHQLMFDCKDGKIDLIMTKSLSTITCNVVECIKTVKILNSMKPPIGIYFENMELYTLDTRNNALLSAFCETLQRESEDKSNRMGACSCSCADFLRFSRKNKRMTQKEVSDRAKINVRHYRMFENGERNLADASFYTAMAVCHAIGIEPESILPLKS